MSYNHQEVERRWQEYWQEQQTFRTADNPKNAFYCLGMFPYPSGAGLHIGHPKSYTATDIVSRMRRAQGYDVLHPMGWDSFGLPAENYAIKTGTPPQETTAKAIDQFRSQLKRLGLSYDWGREINTSDSTYYKWTQWLFLKLYERGLAYQKEAAVNWCPNDQTVLANEQVVNGNCDRCGTAVIQKQLKQWFFKITDYADELVDQLDDLNWPSSIKATQRNWIGRSDGAMISFATQDHELVLDIFTTRPETLYGVTYLVLAPEHPLIPSLLVGQDRDLRSAVEQYQSNSKHKTELERKSESKEKTGMFSGAFAIHPLTGEQLPIWIADYVLATYGTGAVMAVPAHDERDWQFAKANSLPIKIVVKGGEENSSYVDEGLLINSGTWNSRHSEANRSDVIADIEKAGFGKQIRQYRLRDWLVSRQRYWGAPIPIIYCESCGVVPVPEDQLPIVLPTDVDFLPTGESPLTRSATFHDVRCPKCDTSARRESDTMDTFVDSSWYFLRFADPHNAEQPFAIDTAERWLPVDMYVGGAEHAVLHLLYARFITKAIDDIVGLGFREPFQALKNQGLIIGEDGRKMSKSFGNVINPDEIVDQYGADTLRLYEMFLGPFEDHGPWNKNSIVGIRRWLDRVWKLQDLVAEIDDQQLLVKQKQLLSPLIAQVEKHIEEFRFNTAISALMIATRSLQEFGQIDRQLFGVFLQLLAPFAPHIAEELWLQIGNTISISLAPWPAIDVEITQQAELTMVIQVNGKMRATMPALMTDEDQVLIERAKALPNIQAHIGNLAVRAILVPKKLINFVTES